MQLITLLGLIAVLASLGLRYQAERARGRKPLPLSKRLNNWKVIVVALFALLAVSSKLRDLDLSLNPPSETFTK